MYELESGDDDDSESFVDGYVTVFIAAGKPVGPQAQRLVESFNSFLTEIVLRLAKQAPAHKALA